MFTSEPKYIFVSGDRSSVGKSTMCLGILSALVESGDYKPEELAYIKPATQCTSIGLELKYFSDVGIEFMLGPVIFYDGFTRECITGKVESGKLLLDKVENAIRKIGEGKKVVLIDGVGFPAVGSVIGMSNAHVSQRMGAKVLLIGKHGCGDAIDSMNMNLVYFERFGVTPTGAIFNKILPESLQDLKKHVTLFFKQDRPTFSIYGHIPKAAALTKEGSDDIKGRSCSLVTAETTKMKDKDRKECALVLKTFLENVDFDKLRSDFAI